MGNRISNIKEDELKNLKEEELRPILLEMGLKPPGSREEMINLIIEHSKKRFNKGEKEVKDNDIEKYNEITEVAEEKKDVKEEIKEGKVEVEEEEEKEGDVKENIMESEEEVKKDIKEDIKEDDEKVIKEENKILEEKETQEENKALEEKEIQEDNNNNNDNEKKDYNEEDILNNVAESPCEVQPRQQEQENDQRPESPNKMETVIDDDVYASASMEIDENNTVSEAASTTAAVTTTVQQNDKPKDQDEENFGTESCIIHVSGFVRPFSIQDAEELFTKCTGGNPFNYYWMNRIKSNAYVSYKTIADASKAVKELNGMVLQNGSKSKLSAKFGEESVAIRVIMNDAKVNRTPHSIKLVKEFKEKGLLDSILAQSTTSTSSSVKKEENNDSEKTEINSNKRQLEKEDDDVDDDDEIVQPQKKKANTRLDELFMKTKCEPHIYYLPLTDKEVEERDKARKEKRKKEKKDD